jgi:hypothetical protein
MRARDVWFKQDVAVSKSTQTETADDNNGVKDVSFEFEHHWTTGFDVTKMLTE